MRIVGNLDVEVTWARMDAAARRARGEKAPSPDDPRFALPEHVMRKISAAATLLRAFAESDDDVLWTPRPVDPSRMARVSWLPTPRLESGPCPEAADVWWGEPTESAARIGHRGWTSRWRELVGLPCIGANMVRSVEELARLAATGGAWIAKAPYSAAGRLRVFGEGPLDARTSAESARLLDLYGSLLVEPWLSRRDDFGVAGFRLPTTETTKGYVWLAGEHRIDVDARGRFHGIVLSKEVDLPWELRTALANAASAMGVVGCFGVDLFWIDVAGEPPKRHLSEVNPRRTFGHVAHELAKKAQGAVSLRFGRGAPPVQSIPLLLPGADDDTSAWIETSSRHDV